jgi:phospholipid/cholesterol/gamma-HCH transport system permease protein
MASMTCESPEKGKLNLTIKGRVDAESTAQLWPQAMSKLAEVRPQNLEIDAAGVDYCDGAGAALFLELRRSQEQRNAQIRINGLKTEFSKLITLFDPGAPAMPEPRHFSVAALTTRLGQATVRALAESRDMVSFIGEISVKLAAAAVHPSRLRWKDLFLLFEKAGANAVGLASLLGFLIGLILAFQSAIPMARFGAQIFVADLVAISLFREIGPLITAVILASRSGSAFAAELGTMKINEEIDALTTMGLDPVSFLVVPRVIAATFVMPLLTMFNLLLGLIGCGLVMVSIGFPPIVYYNEIRHAAGMTDFLTGFVKTFVFGLVIGAIGCLRGLQTKTGASAVGDSATHAVVSGIIAIVVLDGVFAVIYYFLGI